MLMIIKMCWGELTSSDFDSVNVGEVNLKTRRDLFLCVECQEYFEFCDACGRIIENSDVYTFEEEDSGVFCSDCMKEQTVPTASNT
jgi:hypothetical protein